MNDIVNLLNSLHIVRHCGAERLGMSLMNHKRAQRRRVKLNWHDCFSKCVVLCKKL